MNIRDEEIKSLVKDYQIARSREGFFAIRDMLSRYIYHYPRKVYFASHEDASEFYLYVIERLDAMLLSFKSSDFRFITWFTVVLRNSYINFLHKTRLPRKTLKTISLSASVSEGDGRTVYLEDVLSSEISKKESGAEDANNLDDSLRKNFPIRDALVFRVHYLEIFKDIVIPYLKEYYNIDTRKALRFVERARESYFPKFKRLMRLKDKITSVSFRIEECEERGLSEKANKLKSRKEKYYKLLLNVKIVVPYKYLSAVFKMSVNAVTKVVSKVRDFFKREKSLS